MTTPTILPEPNLRPEISQEEVELAVLGNEDASRRIVGALQPPVISTIYRLLDRRFASEVEDIAQDIFLKVFRSLHRFDPMRGIKLTTWVFAIAKNHCFDLPKQRIEAGGVTDAETVEVFALIGLNTMSTYVNSIANTTVDYPAPEELDMEERE